MLVIPVTHDSATTFHSGRQLQPLVGAGTQHTELGFSVAHLWLDPNGGATPWNKLPDGVAAVYYVLQGEVIFADARYGHRLRGDYGVRVAGGTVHHLVNHLANPARVLVVFRDGTTKSDCIFGERPDAGGVEIPEHARSTRHPVIATSRTGIDLGNCAPGPYDGIHRLPGGRRDYPVTGQPGVLDVGFAMTKSVLVDLGSQVPWHAHAQPELCYIDHGKVEVVVGGEQQVVTGPSAFVALGGEWHQITNLGLSRTDILRGWKGSEPTPLDDDAPDLPRGAIRSANQDRDWRTWITRFESGTIPNDARVQ